MKRGKKKKGFFFPVAIVILVSWLDQNQDNLALVNFYDNIGRWRYVRV